MSEQLTAIERLEFQLNELEEENEKLQTSIDNMKDQEAWQWTVHTTIDEGVDKLPVPRLEISAHRIGEHWYNYEWRYCLVYEHLLGFHIRVPLGHTKVSGGGEKPTHGKLPFRDGAHFQHDVNHFGFQAFVIVDGDVKEYTE